MDVVRLGPARAGRAVTLVVLLVVAVLPAFAALRIASSGGSAGFLPFSDHAVLELQVRHASESLHLLGPYSRYGWHHPGPFYFYLLAPAYALSGHATSAIWATVWTINVLCLGAIVWVVLSAGGRGHALITAVLLALQTHLLRAETLCDPWNPFIVTLPFELLAFTCTAIGAGNPRYLPLATLAASFLVQTHVGTAPGVTALGFAALTTALVRRRGNAEPSSSSAWRRGAAISVVVLAVLWAPVVLEQLSSPVGNLTKLVRFFGEHTKQHTFSETFAAISGHFSMIAHTDASYGTHAAASAVIPGSELARGAMVAMLVSLVLPFGLRRFRGDAYAVSGAIVAATGTVVAVVASTRVVGPLLSYLFIWTAGLGTLSAALGAAEACAWIELAVLRLRSGPRLNKLATSLAPSVALLVSASALRGTMRALPPTPPYIFALPASDITAFSAPIAEHIRSRRWTRPVVRIASQDAWGLVAGVLVALSKQGTPFFVDEEWVFMFGSHLRVRGKPDGVIVFGDHAFQDESRHRRGYFLLGEHGGTFVYAVEPFVNAAASIDR